ncbi:CHAT domain-containing protein [Cyathus striatus]|nr:CHAT domain-containing protein [Cyathus striatus]
MKTFIATKNHIYLEDAVTQYRTATNIVSTALLQRQATARKWAHAVRGYHESAVEAYQIAIALLPEIAATNLNVDSRREALQEADAATICHEGVGCALQFGRFEEAVEFLEQGRAIYWSQVLQLRSPVEALLQKAPELANALQSISSQLQLASLRDSLPNDIHNPQQRRNYEHETAYYEDMQLEWEKVLKEIRNLNGFEDFLLPKKFSTLQKYLEPDETIVLLSETGGFDTASALLISHNEVRHLPLPDIDGGMIAVILPMIKEGRNSVGYRHRSPSIAEIPGIHIPAQVYDEKVQELMQTYRHGRARYETSKKDTSLRDALRWIWDGVSKPIIQALGIEKSGNPKRVWWCPTGPFSFLPLHAAGIYEEDISLSEFQSECVSDYLISSYIPTIGSLLSRRSNPPEASIHSNAELEMMVVLESRTLPWTVEELRRIKKHVIPEQLTILGDGPHNPATVESVVSRLPTASIVHFSCHGLQNVDNPLESALVMDDGLITIRHIMQQPMPHSYLAFLCACETATGSEELADEAMSLGTSLLYSGFQSVVATMCPFVSHFDLITTSRSIADEDGATIADNFYEYLFNESGGEVQRNVGVLEMRLAVGKKQSWGLWRWGGSGNMERSHGKIPLFAASIRKVMTP